MQTTDEWGETPEQRHDRILARDLAYLAFEEGRKRDGLTTSGPELLAFNAGYAAGRADYLPGQASESVGADGD